MHLNTRKNIDTFLPLKKDVRSKRELTPEEKQMIASAMGLGEKHWYQCANGHVYCIGECGVPKVRSKCPYCGAEIGDPQSQKAAFVGRK